MLAEERAKGVQKWEEVVGVAGRGRVEGWGEEGRDDEAVDCVRRGGFDVVGKV